MTRQEKARWLSEIYAAMADGKTLQIQSLPIGVMPISMMDIQT